MAYTVKKLAELSGVSVRTLHWYDEVGLLAPAYIGSNGYRYYEEEQLLRLQQILFYRELDFSLEDIKRILTATDFDQIRALKTHKRTLMERVNHTQELIETVDKTLIHLQGKRKMKENELYRGFDPKKQGEYEQYLIDQYGSKAEATLAESKKRTQNWTTEHHEQAQIAENEIYRVLAAEIEKGSFVDDPAVQQLIQKHHTWLKQYFTADKETYIGLGELYCSHPDFIQFYKTFHSELPTFMRESIKVFANQKL